MGHPGPRRKKFLAKISGRKLKEAERILYGKATWKSWKNQDYDLIGKKTDYSLFARTHMFLWYGTRGPSIKSSQRIWACSRKKAIPLRKRYLPIADTAGSRASSPSDLWRKSQKRIRKRSFKRKKPLPFGRGS